MQNIQKHVNAAYKDVTGSVGWKISAHDPRKQQYIDIYHMYDFSKSMTRQKIRQVSFVYFVC